MSESDKLPTALQIETRADHIINGVGYPHLPALPGIEFHRLNLPQKGMVSRAYSRFIMDEIAAGALFSETLLPTHLRKACQRVGIDYDALMAKEEEFQKRIFDQAPTEFRGLPRRLSDEEFAQLPQEGKDAYIAALQEHTRAVNEFMHNLFTPEERLIRGQIDQVKNLRTQLLAETYEHHARIHQRLTEILHGARHVDGTPYFGSLDELYDLRDTDEPTWLALCAKWREFKEGRWPGFTPRSSSTAKPGAN